MPHLIIIIIIINWRLAEGYRNAAPWAHVALNVLHVFIPVCYVDVLHSGEERSSVLAVNLML